MDWEKRKYKLDLKIKIIEIEEKYRSRLILFIQTMTILTISGTVSILYKSNGKINIWSASGIFLSIILLMYLILNFYKLRQLKDKMEKILEEIEK